ncbi:MAG: hypothetical protein ACLR23_07130 [Clostridia bacterium]
MEDQSGHAWPPFFRSLRPLCLPLCTLYVYQLVEKSSLTIASWRAWDGNSILSQLLKWDGKKPVQPLSPNGHFADGISGGWTAHR